ncbi:MAG: lipid IV(A) 3-deoxy-D-manno-octulosonic acid transferase [Gammaproteobacteria bacterium]
MIRFVYIALSYLIAPLILLFLIWRGFRNHAYWERLPERFGIGLPQYSDECVWVHAVSVGEVQACAVLVERLLERNPFLPVLITTVTPTGSARVKDIFGDRVRHHYAPYDLPGSVSRFFQRVNPRVMIVVETELWPTLYHECGKRQVPLILASARISPPSVAKYRRFISLFKEALSHGIVIAAQSEQDAERFRDLGANPERTHTTGNIKFDFELDESVRENGLAARALHAPNRPVLLAASTHDREEPLVLEAMDIVWRKHPETLLIIAPRHPERFGYVASLLQENNLSFVTRTSGQASTPETRVLLLDTLGELRDYYAASDVAFVGGSLVPIGGHNLLEPAALSIPVVTGSHLYNTEDIAGKLVASGAMRIVEDAHGLGVESCRLLGDPIARRVAGEAGKDVVERNRGALARLLLLIEPLLKKRP